MKKIIVEIEGSAEVELENYDRLLNLIYSCGSDKIAAAITAAVEKSNINKENKSVLSEDEIDILEALSQSFKELKDTSILILETE